jgi:selenocysteine lyase/cysteine desulfurase
VTGASNVTGEVWPVAELAAVAHRHGARIVVDAAQLAPHRAVSLAETGIDYLALSGHKMYAPFGAGILAGRADWLGAAEPYLAGGGATAQVTATTGHDQVALDVRWHDGPARHEAGTPNLFGAVSLAAVCTALSEADRGALEAEERRLVTRLRTGLAALPGVGELRTFGPEADRVGIVSFAVAGRSASEVSQRLGAGYDIGVRDGLFCAHPLTARLLAEAGDRTGAELGASAVRASLGLGSTDKDVDQLLAGVAELAGSAEPAAVAGRP